MAIPADTVWEVRTTGSDSACGGGFSTANKGATGVDYTQQDAAQYTYTSDLSGAGGTTLTSAGSHFTNDILGNVINISGQGFYCVTGYTNTATVTVDRALGTFSGATGYVGGGLATPGAALTPSVDYNDIYLKSGTYDRATALTISTKIRLIGYTSSRTDGGPTRPIIRATANSIVIVNLNAICSVENIEARANTHTGITGFQLNGNFSVLINSFANTCQVGVDIEGLYCTLAGCAADQCGTGYSISNHYYNVTGCVAGNSTTNGYNTGASTGFFQDCIAFATTGRGFTTTARNQFVNCTSDGNTGAGGHGFDTKNSVHINCCATNNAQYGFKDDPGSAQSQLWINCATYNNTAGAFSITTPNLQANINPVALSASPYTSPDFAPNAAAGGGASLRGAGVPTAFPDTTTTNNRDIGAAQHADPAGGGGKRVGPGGGRAG